jgi:hypothetical protein
MAYVLHDIHVPNSRLIVPHRSKSLMIGFPSQSTADTFSRVVLRDYDTFTESITPVERSSSCSKVSLTFPLERRPCDATKRVIIPFPIDEYDTDHRMFHSMTRHEVDFLLIRKFTLDRKADRLRVHGMWIEFNGSVNAVDPIDLYEHNKRALESLFQV